ncbi:MAG: ABC transporter ATP-binding protein [Pyrodictiaceae archaeon]
MVLEVRDAYVYTKNGEKEIVKDVNLTIKEKSLYVLMGPNGAGKSSLALSIMGYKNYLFKGSIRLDGEEISGKDTSERALRGITLAVQNPPELEGVRVSEILAKVARRFRGISSPRETMSVIVEALKVVGLPPSILNRDYMVGMSGGERKKLELARMLVQKPRIAILDEPDSGVDVESLPRIASAIETLVDQGVGVLLISHQPHLVTRLVPDKVYVMQKGRIVAEGGLEIVMKIEKQGYSWLETR